MGLFNAGTRTDRPMVVHDRVVTVANGITALRLLGLPLFVWLAVRGSYGLAFGTLSIVGATDWIDGYVARRFDQVTKLGKLIDPLIDRALLATAGVTLLVLGLIPWWIVALVVARDVVLLTASFVIFRQLNPGIAVSNMGKFATACLLIGVPGFLLARMEWVAQDVFVYLAYGYCIVGIVTYYLAGWRYGQAAVKLRRTLEATGEEPDAATGHPDVAGPVP